MTQLSTVGITTVQSGRKRESHLPTNFIEYNSNFPVI